ncbi:MAG: extracellular solute-binding protein, partial [bacterium]
MVTIRMWVWGSEKIAKHLMKEEERIFKERIPDIDVEVTLIPWRDAWESIINSANEAKGPDVIQVGSTWSATLADLGVLKDITREVFDGNVNRDIFVPAAWGSCYFPGDPDRISSLPWFVDIRAMYYRSDIFSKMKIPSDGLNTWGSFENICKQLKGF